MLLDLTLVPNLTQGPDLTLSPNLDPGPTQGPDLTLDPYLTLGENYKLYPIEIGFIAPVLRIRFVIDSHIAFLAYIVSNAMFS